MSTPERSDMESITQFLARDLRFPTSLHAHGSDAMHVDPDYSCAYVEIVTSRQNKGHGFTFTCGRGTNIVCLAIKELMNAVVMNKRIDSIFKDFGQFYRTLTSESQLRWLGPEKGVIHLASAAILNALWDLRAKLAGKPLWKLLIDMSPQEIVSAIDFRYITDALTKAEAIEILSAANNGKADRERILREQGFPSYTTQVGWLGYSDAHLRELCKKYRKIGYNWFKMKVGGSIDDDIRRLTIARQELGPDAILMTDANQKWDVDKAIQWMKKLAQFNIYWIEEPTSPDDILGHAAISTALKPHGIGVATGEQAQNRVIFKQLLQASAIQFCQIDACRLGSVNENLAVILMAKKFNVPICPHAGGIGLCELVQHLSMFDYVSVCGTMDGRVTEYVDHLHEHMVNPVVMKGDRYMPPQEAGYSCEIKESAFEEYEYPHGNYWKGCASNT